MRCLQNRAKSTLQITATITRLKTTTEITAAVIIPPVKTWPGMSLRSRRKEKTGRISHGHCVHHRPADVYIHREHWPAVGPTVHWAAPHSCLQFWGVIFLLPFLTNWNVHRDIQSLNWKHPIVAYPCRGQWGSRVGKCWVKYTSLGSSCERKWRRESWESKHLTRLSGLPARGCTALCPEERPQCPQCLVS